MGDMLMEGKYDKLIGQYERSIDMIKGIMDGRVDNYTNWSLDTLRNEMNRYEARVKLLKEQQV